MTIIYVRNQNILESECEVLVCPVNCVGVMGKGLALQFKEEFGEAITHEYQKACKNGTLRPGRPQFLRVYGTNTRSGTSTYGVINFLTKLHWRDPSRIEWIDTGLQALAAFIRARNISSIAVPRLGCGLGGLNWAHVRPLIEKHLGDITVSTIDPILNEDGSIRIPSGQPIPCRVVVYE